MRGLSVPDLVCRHAPSPLTPESRSAAHTRCFTDHAGFVQSDGLATPIGVTRLIGFAYATARAFASRGFLGQITPTPRPVGYMANGSFHGELLSVHKTRPVSLTHRRITKKRQEGILVFYACHPRYPRLILFRFRTESSRSGRSVGSQQKPSGRQIPAGRHSCPYLHRAFVWGTASTLKSWAHWGRGWENGLKKRTNFVSPFHRSGPGWTSPIEFCFHSAGTRASADGEETKAHHSSVVALQRVRSASATRQGP